MAQISQHDFTNNLLKLLAETFEGPAPGAGSAYLDGGAGLFQTLGSITSEVASRAPAAGATTIAGHSVHLGYYVRVLQEFIAGRTPEIDWPASWQRQRVGADEWDAVRDDLRRRYEELKAALQALPQWDDDSVGGSMAIVVHTAYHLGAIRQLLRTSESAQRQEPAAGDADDN